MNRSRRYLAGATRSVPLPISVSDINTVIAAHPTPLPRTEIDACIFALDKEWLGSLD